MTSPIPLRPPGALALALAVLLPSGAGALSSSRSIAVESGISSPLRGAAGPSVPLALSASAWLEGDLHAVARLAFADAPETAGRPAAFAVSGTVGVRLAPGRSRLRPTLLAEVGWARTSAAGAPADRVALGVGAGLEWYVVRDVALTAAAALRRTGGWRAELALGAALHF